ncbi:ATP-binding protein [Ancylobacter sonchi]|uniref:ATP-binding protein n=1 Tax=Ancylobacter sonchi TaxID=1937790 RepID=UPI001BD281BE|nr:ATP-binding protein [Ancylobacter sonchi]MBS7532283.1 ATP-binding protein [Ancylobacter sonchi]
MPTLTTDLIGRVKRLPLKPSATSALMPLFEAISNGLHAIDDRHRDKAKDHGTVLIEVLRKENANPSSPVTGFVITDNGIGLNDDNYRSFLRPDSQHKFQRGGKGVGRLGWLKVFKDIHVESTFVDVTGQLAVRSFDFVLSDTEQVVLRPGARASATGPGTRVSLRTYDTLYGTKCPLDAVTLRQKVIGHFMQLFAAGAAPSITMADGVDTVDLKSAFHDLVRNTSEQTIPVLLTDGETIELTIRHIRAAKAIRPDANKKAYNWLFLSANDRAVEETVIDDQIGLKALDSDDVYIGCVSGPHLDAHVNQERTGFSFDAGESREIRRALQASVMAYLATYVARLKEKKRRLVQQVIAEYPQFLYLQGEMEGFINKLAPGVTSREAVYVEMCRHRYRRTNQENNKLEEVSKAGTALTKEVEKRVEQYQAFVQEQQRGVLAEYVLIRKSVIDILDRYAEYQEGTTKHYLEEAVHKLIVPMKTDSASLEIGDHNLWLIDDRLAFFAHFASDHPLKKYTDNPSLDRPDVAFFYDTCFAWREQEAANTVVLVEFKRPSRDDYNGEDNPLKQVISYIKKFKTSTSLKDSKGRQLSPRLQSATFHCYIVADITDSLREAIEGYRFHETPDGQGLVGYLTNPDAVVEIISYPKLLADAKMRNSIFFQKLGITNVDPGAARAENAIEDALDEVDAEVDADGEAERLHLAATIVLAT